MLKIVDWARGSAGSMLATQNARSKVFDTSQALQDSVAPGAPSLGGPAPAVFDMRGSSRRQAAEPCGRRWRSNAARQPRRTAALLSGRNPYLIPPTRFGLVECCISRAHQSLASDTVLRVGSDSGRNRHRRKGTAPIREVEEHGRFA